MPTTWRQDTFRFRNDDGDETTATWIDAAGNSISKTINADQHFRIRIEVSEQGSTSAALTPNLYIQKNGAGGYVQSSASSTTGVKVVASPNFTDGVATTRQICALTFVAGSMDEVDGKCATTGTIARYSGTEAEYSLLLDYANLAEGDYFDFRIYNNTSALNTYTQTGRLTVHFPVTHEGAATLTGTSALTATGPKSGVPTEYTGLVAWFKADAITGKNDGDTITQWDDSSGNAYHAVQKTSYGIPVYKTNILNGKPICRYVYAENDMLELTANGALNSWRNKGYGVLIAVFRTESASVKSDIMFIEDGTNGVGRFGFAVSETGYTGAFTGFGRRLDSDSAQFVSGGTVVANTWYIVAWRVEWANAKAALRVNGTQVASTNSFQTAGNTSDTQSWSVDFPGSGGASFLGGDIAEAVWYNAMLTDAEIAEIETYLNTKWAVYGATTHNGAAVLTGTSDLTVAGSVTHVTHEGAGTLSGTSDLTVAGTLTQAILEGVVNLGGTSSLVVAGTLTHATLEGVSNLAGTSSLTVVGSKAVTHEGASVLTGSSSLIVAGDLTHAILEGATALSGSSILTVAGSLTQATWEGQANLSGTSEMLVVAYGVSTHNGEAVLAGASDLIIAGSVTHAILEGTTSLVGSSDLIVAGGVSHQVLEGAGALSGTSSLVVAGAVSHIVLEGASVLAGTSSLTVAGILTHAVWEGAINLAGSSEMIVVASGAVTHSGAAVLTGDSTMTVAGTEEHAVLEGVTGLQGTSGLIVAGAVTQAVWEGGASLIGSSEMIVEGISTPLFVYVEVVAGVVVLNRAVSSGVILNTGLAENVILNQRLEGLYDELERI